MPDHTEERGRVMEYVGSMLEPGMSPSAFYAGAAPAVGRRDVSPLMCFYQQLDPLLHERYCIFRECLISIADIHSLPAELVLSRRPLGPVLSVCPLSNIAQCALFL